jgi:xanthine dehydrogenase molybdopterin-binding subunit B
LFPLIETHEQAFDAASKVRISYIDTKKPILTIKDAIDASSFWPTDFSNFVVGNADDAISRSPSVVEGEFETNAQYHFYMEQQVAIAAKNEEGYDIYTSTQWTDFIQKAAAQVLGLSKTSAINVMVQQLGGAYGGKITRSALPACAAVVAASLTDRPVRVAFDLKHSMEMIGKRNPFYAKYKVGYDQKTGRILGIKIDWMEDAGCSPNDTLTPEGYYYVDNTYNIANWLITTKMAKTNTPSNTACRAPSKNDFNF